MTLPSIPDFDCHSPALLDLCDLWQQLELASKLESDPGDTVDWGKK